jgi:dTDP-4-amino-4,6-dideoxygalactose transaminase
MKKKNINLQVHYIPIHLQPYYRKKYGLKKGRFPIAEQFYKREVSLPIYFSLKEKEIFKVIRNIKSFCKNK